MYLNNIIICDDAIFIADSHYNSSRLELKQLLLQIQSKQIKTSQIFLMGDIFDFLASQISYFINQNKEIIALINEISLTIEVIYLEGNHDYNLKYLFPKVQVVNRNNQPIEAKYKNKTIALSHGDIFTPIGYNIYTNIIRNSIFLNFLNLIDINNWLTKKIDNWLLKKNICNKCKNINNFIDYRLNLYTNNKVNIVIEGHFHYGINHEKYINIPSLACSNQYYSIKENNFICLF